MTAQETGLQIPRPVACRAVGELRFEADYDPEEAVTAEKREKLRARQAASAADGSRQSTLFDE